MTEQGDSIPVIVKVAAVWLLYFWNALIAVPAERWQLYLSIAATAVLIVHRLWHWKHPPKGGK